MLLGASVADTAKILCGLASVTHVAIMCVVLWREDESCGRIAVTSREADRRITLFSLKAMRMTCSRAFGLLGIRTVHSLRSSAEACRARSRFQSVADVVSLKLSFHPTQENIIAVRRVSAAQKPPTTGRAFDSLSPIEAGCRQHFWH